VKYGKTLLLLLVVFIAFLLRFYSIGVNPPSLTWDEVAWGYNGYSLGIDGRDEFGRFLPHDYLESFGDFKPPVYAYLAIIPVKLFGLTAFATRFPSAFSGTLTVLLTYFLALELFPNAKHKRYIGLFSAGILAVSPWHINLSRAAFEANVATLFLVTGVWLFLKAIQKNPWYLTLSATSFVLSMYTFNTSRVVTPLLVVALGVGFYKQLLKYKKAAIIAAVLGFILLLPTLGFLFSPQAKLRFAEVNIFTDLGVIERSNLAIARDNNALWSKVIHNRRFLFTLEFMKHYFDNLTPQFLFIQGDGNPKFSTQDVGQMYLWELPFLIIGSVVLFKRKEGNWWIIPLWLIIGIIPAATARETPHALRTETTLPMFQVFVAYGIVQSASFLRKHTREWARLPDGQGISAKGGSASGGDKYLKLFALCYSLFAIFSFAYYLHGYYVFYPKTYSGEWQYGYKEAIEYVKTNDAKYHKIYMTEALGRPYAYFLFYLTYAPQKFRNSAVVEREALGFVHVTRFGKYSFAKNIMELPEEDNVLYIDVPENVPSTAHIVRRFNLLNNKQALIAYTH
jgi:4-amino-4-deoxy-L-arabinose transferase-like glycosyltransferase